MLFSTAPVLLQYCINLNREQSKSIWPLAIQERLFLYTFQHDSELDCWLDYKTEKVQQHRQLHV